MSGVAWVDLRSNHQLKDRRRDFFFAILNAMDLPYYITLHQGDQYRPGYMQVMQGAGTG